MTPPLKGKWKVRVSNRDAAAVLPTGTELTIGDQAGEYHSIDSTNRLFSWQMKYISDDRGVIVGDVTEGPFTYCFVIAIGQPYKIQGIVYRTVSPGADDPDPGTWEADEVDVPPDELCGG